jgi:hypothetical protein
MGLIDIVIDKDSIKNHWKIFVLGVITNIFFWYLAFFLFKRDIFKDFDFYVPILLSIPLSIIWYLITIFYSYSFLFLFNKKDSKYFKMSNEELNPIIFSVAIIDSILMLGSYIFLLYFFFNSLVMKKFIAITFMGNILILLITFILLKIKMSKNEVKEKSK